MNYDDDDFSQGYGQIEEAFRALTKDGVLKPHITDHDVRSSNEDDNIGSNSYVFDLRYQKNLESAQPIKVEYKFSESVPVGTYGYDLDLTNKFVSKRSYGQTHFDLVYF